MLSEKSKELLNKNEKEVKEMIELFADSVNQNYPKYINDFIAQFSYKKDWEVLEFKDDKNIFHSYDIHNERWNQRRWCEYHLENNHLITKVRRLSDGLVFEVGQETNKGKIEKFEIKDNNIMVTARVMKSVFTLLFNLSELVETFRDEFDILRNKFDVLKKDFDQLAEKIKSEKK